MKKTKDEESRREEREASRFKRDVQSFLEQKGLVELQNSWGFSPKLEAMLSRLSQLVEKGDCKSYDFKDALSSLRTAIHFDGDDQVLNEQKHQLREIVETAEKCVAAGTLVLEPVASLLNDWFAQNFQNSNLDKHDSLNELIRRLVAYDHSYDVSEEDIEKQKDHDRVVFDWWLRCWLSCFGPSVKESLWSKRHDEFLLQMREIAKDYLALPDLHNSCLTNLIAMRLLEPYSNVLSEHFTRQIFGPNRWFARLSAPWNILTVYFVSGLWVAGWSLAIVTSFLFLPTPATVAILVLSLAFFFRRWKLEQEWQKLRATKVTVAGALPALAAELQCGSFNAKEVVERIREITTLDLQLPTILVSLLELEYVRGPDIADS